MSRREALLALGGLVAASRPAAAASPADRWLPAARIPMQPPSAVYAPYGETSLRLVDETLRQFFPLVLPGQRLRLLLSNQFGREPLEIGAAALAWRDAPASASVVPDTRRELRFDGRAGVRIPPGGTRLSDPLDMPPAPAWRTRAGVDEGIGPSARPDLAVTLHFPGRTPSASWHVVGARSRIRTVPGNHVDEVMLPPRPDVGPTGPPELDRCVQFVAGVDVAARPGDGVWIAFGDSIVDGAWHAPDTDGSWPLQWSRRWAARARGSAPAVGVLNAGIGGNRLLAAHEGPSGEQRFGRDVLDVPGALGVVLAHGVNDLGSATAETMADTAARLRDGIVRLARSARQRGLKVVVATMTPVGGSFYDRPDIEAARQEVNAWLRRRGGVEGVDAVVDFDRLVRDPARPRRFRAGWTIDQLHPSDRAYREMGREIVRVLDRAGLAPRRRRA